MRTIADAWVGNNDWRTGSVSGYKIDRLRHSGHASNCAYRLTRTALSEMKQKEPELAATFHEFAAHLLSERLTSITRTLEAVLR